MVLLSLKPMLDTIDSLKSKEILIRLKTRCYYTFRFSKIGDASGELSTTASHLVLQSLYVALALAQMVSCPDFE
jgi:hypothetical protein